MKFLILLLVAFSSPMSLLSAEETHIKENVFYQAMMESSNQLLKEDDESVKKSLEIVEKYSKESNVSKIEVVKTVSIPAFHNQNESMNEMAASLCSQCHNQWPHEKNVRLRSMLNMHNSKMTCETCHFQLEVSEKNAFSRIKSTLEDSLIAPFNNGKPIIVPKEHEFSKAIKNQWLSAIETLSSAQINDQADSLESKQKAESITLAKTEIARLYSLIHRPLVNKKDHLQCDSCHRKDQPYLNLAPLINDDKRLERYSNNIIANFFSRYKEDGQKIKIINLLR